MAEEIKKATGAKKSTSTAKKAAPKAAPAETAEAPKAAAPAKKVSKKTGNGNKKAAIVNRLQTKYENEVRKALLEKYNYSSTMQIPGPLRPDWTLASNAGKCRARVQRVYAGVRN